MSAHKLGEFLYDANGDQYEVVKYDGCGNCGYYDRCSAGGSLDCRDVENGNKFNDNIAFKLVKSATERIHELEGKLKNIQPIIEEINRLAIVSDLVPHITLDQKNVRRLCREALELV
jgi:hypothetical protein